MSNQSTLKSAPTLWETVEAGWVPRPLKDAALMLTELADLGGDAFTDELCNDAAQNYPAIVAAIDICRAMLKELDRIAAQQLAKELAYHRKAMEEIESLGVL